MSQLIKFLLLLILFLGFTTHSFAALKGELQYKIPIDYTKLSREELDTKAGFYYNLALKTSNGSINQDITDALNLYAILSEKCPDVQFYKIRMGILYDIIGKDKYSKGYFHHAIGLDSTQAEPYYRLGEFYYRREIYKKALKMYKESYKKGYDTHYETLYKLGDIYEKFGDTDAALKYLKLAFSQNPNEILENKITKLESLNEINYEYYSDTRIRINER